MNMQRTITIAAVFCMAGAFAAPARAQNISNAINSIFTHRDVTKATAGQDPFEDDHTQAVVQGVQVHVCRDGALLVGVDASNNRFLCSHASHIGDQMLFAVDSSTHQTFTYGNGTTKPVHVCPGNSAMVGWAQDRNWLICTGGNTTSSLYRFTNGGGNMTADGPGGTQHREPRHQDRSMHSCNADGAAMTLAMKGIEANDNVIICMNVNSSARLLR